VRTRAVTHFDERCQQACVAFNAAIATAISTSGDVDAQRIWRSARDEVSHPDLVDDLDHALSDDPDLLSADVHLYEHKASCAWRFRLRSGTAARSQRRGALIDVVNRGGDATPNGAIGGALLGAFTASERFRAVAPAGSACARRRCSECPPRHLPSRAVARSRA